MENSNANNLNNNSKDTIAALEAERLKVFKLRKLKKSLPYILGGIIILSILIGVICLFLKQYFLVFSCFGVIVGLPQAGIFLYIILHFIEKNMSSSLKPHVVPQLIESLDPTFKYLGHSGINRDDFSDAGFYNLAYADNIYVEDSFTGVLCNRYFKFGEVTIKEKSDDTTITVFNGQFLKIDFNDSIRGTTIVTTKRVNRYTRIVPGKPKLNTISLEDIEFNEIFKVKANDEIEARKVLTPVFMEKLKNLKSRNNCKVLDVSVSNGSIYLLINQSKNLFEIDVENSLYERDIASEISDDFNVISDICEFLNLNY